METLFAVIILFLALKLSFDSIYKKLFKSGSKKNKKAKVARKKAVSTDPRELAIQNLLEKVEKAKANHPDLVQDPERAAKILKLWVNQDGVKNKY